MGGVTLTCCVRDGFGGSDPDLSPVTQLYARVGMDVLFQRFFLHFGGGREIFGFCFTHVGHLWRVGTAAAVRWYHMGFRVFFCVFCVELGWGISRALLCSTFVHGFFFPCTLHHF